MHVEQAIVNAKNAVTRPWRVGDHQWEYHAWSAQHKAWWMHQHNPSYQVAVSRARSAKIRIALEQLGCEADYIGDVVDDTAEDGKDWRQVVRQAYRIWKEEL